MRKIVVGMLLSLDGVAEAPDSFFADWDDAMDANLAAVIAPQDPVILGRRSYTESPQVASSTQIQPFATFINGVTKRTPRTHESTKPGSNSSSDGRHPDLPMSGTPRTGLSSTSSRNVRSSRNA